MFTFYAAPSIGLLLHLSKGALIHLRSNSSKWLDICLPREIIKYYRLAVIGHRPTYLHRYEIKSSLSLLKGLLPTYSFGKELCVCAVGLNWRVYLGKFKYAEIEYDVPFLLIYLKQMKSFIWKKYFSAETLSDLTFFLEQNFKRFLQNSINLKIYFKSNYLHTFIMKNVFCLFMTPPIPR